MASAAHLENVAKLKMSVTVSTIVLDLAIAGFMVLTRRKRNGIWLANEL
jgi:hypothetical protein